MVERCEPERNDEVCAHMNCIDVWRSFRESSENLSLLHYYLSKFASFVCLESQVVKQISDQCSLEYPHKRSKL